MIPSQLKERIDYIENDPSCSYWLKQAWADLKKKDIVDAIGDVELLADMLHAKWHSMQDTAGVKL